MGTNKQTQATSKLEPQFFLRITSAKALERCCTNMELFVDVLVAKAMQKHLQKEGN